MTNLLKKQLIYIFFSLFTLSGNAEILKEASQSGKSIVRHSINVNSSGILIPNSPLESAAVIFLLIVGLAFGISRVKTQPISNQ